MKTVSDYSSCNLSLNLPNLRQRRNHASQSISIVHHSQAIPYDHSLKKRDSELREEISAADQLEDCGKSGESCGPDKLAMPRPMSVGCHRSFWLRRFCFTNFAIFVVIISLHVLNPIATSSDQQTSAEMKSEDSVVTPNDDTDSSNSNREDNRLEDNQEKTSGEVEIEDLTKFNLEEKEVDKTENLQGVDSLPTSNAGVEKLDSNDGGVLEPSSKPEANGADQQNTEEPSLKIEKLDSDGKPLSGGDLSEKSEPVKISESPKTQLDAESWKVSEGIERKESRDSSLTSSTQESSGDVKKESEHPVASDGSSKEEPAVTAQQQDPPPVERKHQDSRSLINDLLQDSNIAGQGQQVTDSNIQEPRVISNSSRVVNGSVVINETVDQKVEETEKEDMFTFQEWKEQKLMEEQLSKEAAAASSHVASNGAVAGGASGSEQGSGNANQAAAGINGNSAGVNGHTGASGSNGGSAGGGSGFKVQQYTQNFASADCGAKVLDAPASSQGRDAILHSDRDKYLNFPCDEPKKYFVIELCEPIQLKVLDIGCYELFSSLLANFTVHGSDRYPSREWKLLGNFTAKNDRTLQSYNFADQMYYKYVRVEYLSHYGKEHYCPVSSVRAFGLTIEVEDEEQLLADDNQNSVQDNQDHEQTQLTNEDTKNMNVLSTVTDAMAKIANKIIGSRLPATDDAKSVNESASLQKDEKDSTEKEQNSGSTYPEVPRPQTDANYSDFAPSSVVAGGTFNMNPPVIMSPNLSLNTFHNSSDLSNAFPVNMSLAYPDFVPMYICDEDLMVLLTCPLYQYLFAMKRLKSQCCIVSINEHPPDVKVSEADGNPSETKTVSGNQETKPNIEVGNPQGTETTSEGSNANGAANVNENSQAAAPSPNVVDESSSHHASSGTANGGGGGSGSIVQKESLLVRLRNKVRELEFNMSLSSDYLEQLSRRYKKQMDEITAKHNKTLTALISTNEEAASRDVKHSQKILELESDVIRLTNRVVQLEESMTNMTDTLVLQHMMFISVEFAVFALFIFLYILKSCRSITNHSYNPINKRSRSLDDTMTNERRTRSSSEGRGTERLTNERNVEDPNDGRLGFCDELMPSIEDLVVPQATPFRTKHQTGQNKNVRHMKQNGTVLHPTNSSSIPPRPASSASMDSTSNDGFSLVGKKKRRSKSGATNNSSIVSNTCNSNNNSNQKYLMVERSPSSSSSVASSVSVNTDNRNSNNSNVRRTSATSTAGDPNRPNYLSVI